MASATQLRHLLQETRELGMFRTAARFAWEWKVRTGGLIRTGNAQVQDFNPVSMVDVPWPQAPEVSRAMEGRVPGESLTALRGTATEAIHGRIHCFGHWQADFGDPVDWQLQPVGGGHWPKVHWSQAMRTADQLGDVKFTWEVGRFPQAYYMARAAAFDPAMAPVLASGLFRQIKSFREDNPFDQGIQWYSGQEIAIRLWAWLFALSAFRSLGIAVPDVSRDLYVGAVHVAQHIDYARFAVYNNHLLSEALCLYMAGVLLPDVQESERWCSLGFDLLTEQASSQIYSDGSYIQNSHNYHRFAMQVYLLAWMLAKRRQTAPREWCSAMERSLDFLYAHQNPDDGRLPNYGANDGALPLILSTCDFSDFRPTLQALSLATRGERLYSPGPWDEEAAWFLGPEALQAPQARNSRSSVSFEHSGYHVLRGSDGNFATFRCGTITDRFSQIDMLHLDVWWRGQNVITDGGSYS